MLLQRYKAFRLRAVSVPCSVLPHRETTGNYKCRRRGPGLRGSPVSSALRRSLDQKGIPPCGSHEWKWTGSQAFTSMMVLWIPAMHLRLNDNWR
jgi:hypothetical protein